MNICSLQTEEPFYFFWDTPQCGFIQQQQQKVSNVLVTECHRYTHKVWMDIQPSPQPHVRTSHAVSFLDIYPVFSVT